MTARISREHLSDESLNRARMALLQQLSTIGATLHRFRDNSEITYEVKKDEDAVCDVLGILLHEQRMREIEDADMALMNGEG